MSDVSFVDAHHGWMLAYYLFPDNQTYESTLDATTDGGQTWQTLTILNAVGEQTNASPGPGHQAWNRMHSDGFLLPDTISGDTYQVSYLRFINTQDGWAFGPDLIFTRDGGKTWTKETTNGDVLALEIAGGMLWLVETTCPDDVASICETNIRTSTDNGQTWQLRTLLPNVMPSKLTAADGKYAWILQDADIGNLSILATNDGGKNWKPVHLPPCCFGYPDLAAADKQTLWYVEGTIGAGPFGAKRVYVSSDGGQHWQLKGQALLPPNQPGDNMDALGALEHMYALSDQSVWMTMYRGAPIVTKDGGKTWHTLDNSLDMGDVGQNRRLFWTDPQTIWYYSDRWLLHTNDGGKTWTCQRARSEDNFSNC